MCVIDSYCTLEQSEFLKLKELLPHFKDAFTRDVTSHFDRASLGPKSHYPTEWQEFEELFAAVTNFFSQGKLNLPSSERLRSFIKCALIHHRRNEANRIEIQAAKTIHPVVKGNLEKELVILDKLINLPWFAATPTYKLPKLAEFLSIQSIMAGLQNGKNASARKYDEKFQILQSPDIFQRDLDFLRKMADLRGSHTTVAFVDIDDFKKVNSEHSETIVDRIILPQFMRLLESHVYSHGHAYRQGGDEYLFTIPMLSRSLSCLYLEEMRQAISDQSYPGLSTKITVSIGACTVSDDCYLTNQEIVHKANQAKNFAKANGKNRIAWYRGGNFSECELEVWQPKQTTDGRNHF